MTEADLVMFRHELYDESHASDYNYIMYKGDDNHTRVLDAKMLSQITPDSILQDAGLNERPIIYISDKYHIGDLVMRIDLGIVIEVNEERQTLTIASAKGEVEVIPAASTMLVVRAEDLLMKYEESFVNYTLYKERNEG